MQIDTDRWQKLLDEITTNTATSRGLNAAISQLAPRSSRQ